MKNIGMMVAVEISSVLKRYGGEGRKERIDGFDVYNYTLGDCELHVVNSGAGELAAAAATQMLIDKYEADMVVNFGVVGGLTQEMAQTRTCVVEKIVHYDFDLSEIDHVPVGKYPEYEDIYIPVSGELLKKALEAEPSLKKAVCASGDKFVGTAEGKKQLHELYGADICEMEAAAIALTCNRCGVPFLSVKTVSDSIDGGGDEFYRAVAGSSEICLEITENIIKGL